MASIKVKFRPSTIENKQGVIYYQIIQDRVIRQIATQYKIHNTEWNKVSSSVDIPLDNSSRTEFLTSVDQKVKLDVSRIGDIITLFNKEGEIFSADDVVSTFVNRLSRQSFFKFSHNVICRLRELRKPRCVETYSTTLKSFMRFRAGVDLLLTDFNSEMMLSYQAYLKYEGLSMNTISFYMRVLRAIYNRAVEQELIEQKYPFKKVYTGVGKTIKRAMTLTDIKKIKDVDLSLSPKMAYSRDMFMLSFYLRGMSFVDMAYLRKKDLQNNIIHYYRRKTGQQLNIKWEKCMQEIINRYAVNPTQYLLPIITKSGVNERAYYQNELAKINNHLKTISLQLSLQVPLTMYVARHSWASVAKSRNIPISVISEGMGHDSEATTQIYLASLDTAVIDKANSQILKLLM